MGSHAPLGRTGMHTCMKSIRPPYAATPSGPSTHVQPSPTALNSAASKRTPLGPYECLNGHGHASHLQKCPQLRPGWPSLLLQRWGCRCGEEGEEVHSLYFSGKQAGQGRLPMRTHAESTGHMG